MFKKFLLFTFILALFSASSFGQFFGTTRHGGTAGGGTIYRMNVDGTGISTVHNFGPVTNQGRFADYSQLLSLPNGMMYGTTRYGGITDNGTLFQYNPATNAFTTMVNFDAVTTKGADPTGSLCLLNAKLYGVTHAGGPNFLGVIYVFDPAGPTYTKLANFSAATGSAPFGGMVVGTDNKLYGLTTGGGNHGFGTLYKFDPANNQITVMHHFDGTNTGKIPLRNLTPGAGNILYGMTVDGGAHESSTNGGVLFQFNTSTGLLTKLKDFDAATIGGKPVGSLIQSSVTGKFYGGTTSGGTSNKGTLFELDPATGAVTKKVDFTGTNGVGSFNILCRMADDKMYASTEVGGTNDSGVIFEFIPATGVLTKRFDFNGFDHGYSPKSSLALATNGKLYGMTSAGGYADNGTLFEYDPVGNTVTKKIDFKVAPTGIWPENSLVQASNGKLLGVTSDGGTFGTGVIYEFDPYMNSYIMKVDFNDYTAKGSNPAASLVLANNGKYYGTTTGGGANGRGILFEYEYGSNTFTKKLDFIPAYAEYVFASLVFKDNVGYGVSKHGGTGSYGTIFEFDYVANTFTKTTEFLDTNGKWPVGAMIVASNGLLYGTTSWGAAGQGTLFSYDPVGHGMTTVVQFTNADGAGQEGGLVEFEGLLYGVTPQGGAHGYGTLYTYDFTNNIFTKKLDLTSENAGSISTLSIGANRKLYGTSAYGGVNSIGTVFEYDIDNNTITTTHTFNGTTGSHPGFGGLLSATLPPYVPIISPDVETVGKSIEITGSNFNPNVTGNTVYFGPVKATVTAATPTKLTVTVPPGAPHNKVTVTANNHTGYSFKPFITSFPGGQAITATSFEPNSDLATGGYPTGTIVADINGDGKPEIIVANNTSGNISIFPNQSTAGSLSATSFGARVNFVTPTGPVGLAAGDLNSDGKLDLVVANNGANSISIFPNISNSTSITDATFGTRIDLAAGTGPYDVAIADLEMDGKPDIVVSNLSGAPVSVFENVRNAIATGPLTSASFAAKFDLSGGNTGANSVRVADMDDNGQPDIVIGQAGGNVSIYRYNSLTGVLSPTAYATRVDFTTAAVNGFAIGDIDGDRLPDIAVAANPTTISLFRNTSTAGAITAASFATKVDITVASGNNVALADMEGDGKLDLVTSSRATNSVHVYRNTGNATINASTFTSSVTLLSGVGPGSALPADLDLDGKPDVVTVNNANVTTNTISVIRNNALAAPPGAQPTNFTYSNVTTTGMTISFNAAASVDGYIALMSLNQAPNINPVNGVNYFKNSVIGQVGGNDIKVVHVGSATDFIVNGLPPSTTAFFAIYSYKGGPSVYNYLTVTPLTRSRSTFPLEPTTQATGITFSSVTHNSMTINFTNGNGSSRVVVVRAGAAVDAPVDGTVYTADPSATGAADIGTNTYVVGTATPVTITGLTASTTYHVQVFESNGTATLTNYNASGSTGNPATQATGAPDITKPLIQLIPVGATAAGAQVNVSATVTDAESEVTAVTLLYRSISGGGTPTPKVMTKGTNNVYSASIEPAAVGELGVEYRVIATSTGGTNEDGKYTGIAVTSSSDGGPIGYDAFGSDQINYRIVAVPLVLTAKSASSVFNELGAINKKTWRLSHYDNGTNTELTASSLIEPGLGYWLLIKSSGVTVNTGPGNTVTTSSDDNFSIDLKTGWNQVGNPYPFNLVWADVISANPGLPPIRTYRSDNPGGGSYPWADGSVLRAKEGGFINNTGAPMKLKFPVLKNAGRTQENPLLSNPLHDRNWQLYVVAKHADLQNRISGIGMREKASLKSDQFDGYSMPRFFEKYLELNHTKKTGDDFMSMDIVPASGEHTWEFRIESSESEQLVTLEWDNSNFGDNTKGLILWDDARQVATDMRENSSYTFDRGTSDLFRVYFGERETLNDKVEIRGLVLHSVSPNPAAADVHIAFSVPGSLPVSFEAIDLLGRKAWSTSGQFEKGYHEMTWQGETRLSARGMYIIRVKAGDQIQSTRIYMK
jgi:uncharacterized repeat protein (TIGR03803 family)